MKKPIKIFVFTILCCLLAVSNQMAAQDHTITGTVYDGDETFPLPQATVTIKGTSQKVETDIDGHYSITASYCQTLVFTHIACKSLEIQIEEKNIIDATLAFNPDSLIACGYIQKKQPFFGRLFHSIGNIFKKNDE